MPHRIGDRIAKEFLGARPGQVVVADSTSVCFYKLAAAALEARPERREIVTDRDNFPTDRYVLESLAQQRGLAIRWLESARTEGPTPAQVAAAVGEQTALVTFSHVAYRSAFVLDMAAINQIAHAAGALALWDLSHSAGAIGVELERDGADLAVGCTYKYLNGGPGAPAFLYVAERHQRHLSQPIWGWLGRRNPFEMQQGYEAVPGIGGWLTGTPPVLSLAAVVEGVELVASAGIERIAAKGRALTELAVGLTDAWLADHGAALGSPRDPSRRGAHIAIEHPRARSLSAALIARGVIVDFRTPDAIRIGLSPLSTSFVDVWDGLSVLRELLAQPQTGGG
jgi:kynureninase